MSVLVRAKAIVVALVVLLVPAAFAGCGGGTAERVLTLDDIAQAARSTSEASTGRFAFALEMTAPDGYDTISFSGYGAFDSAAKRTRTSLDLSALASYFGSFGSGSGAPDLGNPELWKVDAVLDGLVMYLRFPLLSRLPETPLEGKRWVRLDLRRAARTAGLDLEQLKDFSSNDPRDLLRMLEAVAGDLDAVDDEVIRGVETTHYRAAVDLRRYERLLPASQREKLGSMLDQLVEESGLATIPVEVWVDDESLVHKMTMTMSGTQPGTGQELQATIRFDLYDYGKPVSIRLPRAAAVFDIEKLR